MDYKLKKDRIALCETVYDADTELPIECDLLLPDYCADIVKLLRCRVKPYLTKSQVMGEKCMLEGKIEVSLYYAGTDGKLQVSEHKAEFSKTLEMRGAVRNPMVFCSLREEYFNGKAISQRRVDLRGALTASVKVISCDEEEMVSAAEGAGLQLRRQPMVCTQLSGEILRRFTLRDEMPFPENLPAPQRILRHDERVRVTDWRIAGAKLLVKGELQMDLVYLSREDTVERTAFQLPVSQMVDLDTVVEAGSGRVFLQILGASLHLQAMDDGSAGLAVEYALLLKGIASRECTILPAVDAYSTQYEVLKEDRRGMLVQQVAGLPVSLPVPCNIPLPEGMTAVFDSFCDGRALALRPASDGLWLSGKLRWCVLGLDGDGVPVCIEKEEPLSLSIPLSGVGEDCIGLWQITVQEQGIGTEEKGHLCCSAQITVDGALYRTEQVQYLTGLRVDESRAKKPITENAMTIYYADAGESLWSIAKEYQTSMEAVMEENGLENAYLEEKKAILIPMIG